MISLFRGPITLGKGLTITGSLGGVFSFFGLKGDAEREWQFNSTVKGVNWESGLVTPLFNSSWLGGGFEKKTKYSFGYIARVNGTDFFKDSKSSRRVRRDVRQNKQQEQEANLTLVEQISGKSIIENSENKSRKGLTPKKFLLIGSNRQTKEVEVTGLVSLIQQGHRGIQKKCSFREEDGAIQNGHCDKAFFKNYSGEESETAPGFISKELKNTKGNKAVAILGLSQKNGNLGVIWGSRKIKEKSGNSSEVVKWSRTGYLYQNQSSKKKKVFTALKSDNNIKGFFVVHDLVFSEVGLDGEWRKKYETNGTILASEAKTASKCKKNSDCLKVVDIPLSKQREYWIWDPSKTQIKNGEFVTDDGIKLPFKLSVNTTWNSLLVK